VPCHAVLCALQVIAASALIVNEAQRLLELFEPV
jgi:hypothetical protein